MERPQALDPSAYTDPELFAVEMDRVFARTWQLVGHRSQLAEPGRLITARIGDQSVVVTNDGGEITAFHNVCQHRGHELVLEEAATTPIITCPYHAWVYDLGGRLTHARGHDVGEICVPRVRVEEHAGFLFVNLDPDAAKLEETIPGIEAELLAIAPDAAERVLTARLTHEFAANWKIAVENYNECFHCPNVHKAFTAGVVSAPTFRITPRGNTIHHTAEAVANTDYERFRDGDDYGSFYTWPASSIQCYPGQVLNTFRWVPLAVDRTLLIRDWWFDRDEPTAAQQTVIDLDWTTTVAEDFDLMESCQRGMHSRGYRPGPLIVDPSGTASTQYENAVPHLHRLWREAMP